VFAAAPIPFQPLAS
jgi:hypothetical protein